MLDLKRLDFQDFTNTMFIDTTVSFSGGNLLLHGPVIIDFHFRGVFMFF